MIPFALRIGVYGKLSLQSNSRADAIELLEMCEYFEKVLRDGSRSSIASALELLSRDNCPYTPILKAKGIIQKQ